MSFTDADWLADKQPAALQSINKYLPDIVSILLVIAIGYTLAHFSWHIYQTFFQPQPAIQAAQIKPATPAAKPQQGVRVVTGSHLFGKTSTVASAPAPSKAPVTKLNLVLRGVLAANPDSLAAAIIATGKGGKEEVYSIGDTIQRGVKLSEIHDAHVIIDRQGRQEKLELIKSVGLSGADISRKHPKTTRTTGTPGTLKDIRSEIMKNPTSFGEYALPVVVKQNGKQVGYRLKPQKKGQLLTQHGLQASDIITEINGVKLDKPQNGIKALRELSTASQVNLMVKRGNSVVPLNIQLQ